MGCFSPQHHGPGDEGDRNGVGADLDGTLYAQFRNVGHLINTDRLLVLIGDPTLDCLQLHTLMEGASLSDPEAMLENNEILWQSDRDACDYIEPAQDNWENETYAADLLPIPVPVYAGVTVALVGYNPGAQKPSLFSCRNSASADALNMVLTIDEGYDPDLPGRYITLTERCQKTVR